MGNCAAPGTEGQVESNMSLGMLNKNAMLSKHRQNSATTEPSLSSGMFVSLNLYTKVDGFSAGEEPKKPYANFCINETSDKPAEEEEAPKRKSMQMRLLILNYTLKYGDTEINWVEKNCNWLHKSKKIKLEY